MPYGKKKAIRKVKKVTKKVPKKPKTGNVYQALEQRTKMTNQDIDRMFS